MRLQHQPQPVAALGAFRGRLVHQHQVSEPGDDLAVAAGQLQAHHYQVPA